MGGPWYKYTHKIMEYDMYVHNVLTWSPVPVDSDVHKFRDMYDAGFSDAKVTQRNFMLLPNV